MSNANPNNPPSKPSRRKRLIRWLGRITLAVIAILIAYLLFRMIYPGYLESKLPPDAPRIAFSLDGTLLGRLGITDATYQRVMTKAGARLIPIRPEASTDPNNAANLLQELDIDGLLLTGGGDIDPNLSGAKPGNNQRLHRPRDDFEIALIHAAGKRGIPILGICRGAQILNVALGGTVKNLRHDPTLAKTHLTLTGHPVEIDPNSTLAQILAATTLENAISLHGQAVDKIAPNLRIAATGPQNITEAIESDPAKTSSWLLAIQWHPELKLTDKTQQKIFHAFTTQAKKTKPQ